MTEKELVQLCKLGETTTTQFKLVFTSQKQIAEEMVAFANTRGGIIIFGTEDKTGKMVGLTYEQVQYTTRELGNTANEHVRPTIYMESIHCSHLANCPKGLFHYPKERMFYPKGERRVSLNYPKG